MSSGARLRLSPFTVVLRPAIAVAVLGEVLWSLACGSSSTQVTNHNGLFMWSWGPAQPYERAADGSLYRPTIKRAAKQVFVHLSLTSRRNMHAAHSLPILTPPERAAKRCTLRSESTRLMSEKA